MLSENFHFIRITGEYFCALCVAIEKHHSAFCEIYHLARGSRKPRKPFGSEKPFVIMPVM